MANNTKQLEKAKAAAYAAALEQYDVEIDTATDLVFTDGEIMVYIPLGSDGRKTLTSVGVVVK
jgi:hypothetical protein